eukprot:gene12544-8966_t
MLKRSVGTYVAYMGVGIASMMAGATAVHELYKPDLVRATNIRSPTDYLITLVILMQ